MWDENVLIDAGCSPGVVAHCVAVSRTAAAIAEKVRSVSVDRELVRQGGLLHDIGRARSHDIRHALEGVKLGKKLGLSVPELKWVYGIAIGKDPAFGEEPSAELMKKVDAIASQIAGHIGEKLSN